MKTELIEWFGSDTDSWTHLRTDIIQHALPEQLPESALQNYQDANKGFLEIDGMMICGDHTTSVSIEEAIISGNQTAAALLKSMGLEKTQPENAVRN